MWRNSKCSSKHLITKKRIFLILKMMAVVLLFYYTQKMVYDWNTLTSPILYAHVLLDSLPTILLLVNTGKGFSQINYVYVHAVILLLRWELTFYMTVNSIKSHGTQSKSLLKMFSLFLNLIIAHCNMAGLLASNQWC